MLSAPKSQRLHIAIVGKRNSGKSSLINAITNQQIAIVSPVPGTTTDPVSKAMEILPIGPILLTDTAGFDDEGEVGSLRVARTRLAIEQADIALLVIDALEGPSQKDAETASFLRERKIPSLTVLNKIDASTAEQTEKSTSACASLGFTVIPASAKTRKNIPALLDAIVSLGPLEPTPPTILGDLFSPGDTIILNCPIDSSAPKGRIILPQVNAIRDVLDHGGKAIVVQTEEIRSTLQSLSKPPALVVTDSQAFEEAAKATPGEIPFTSFSILFARYLSDIHTYLEGIRTVDSLKPGDKVLIAESCTHRRCEEDIGMVKIPNWLNNYVGGKLEYSWSSGYIFPEDISSYKLIIHCGGCMANRRELLYRVRKSKELGIPITNYGILIAKLHGLLERAIKPLHLSCP
ncbi:MAG: [FeFe] hydrogenase H-cluster maturation GTPase HydF [Candidatus Micrarchaeota archaeon]